MAITILTFQILASGGDAQLFSKVVWYQAWAQEWWRDKLATKSAGQVAKFRASSVFTWFMLLFILLLADSRIPVSNTLLFLSSYYLIALVSLASQKDIVKLWFFTFTYPFIHSFIHSFIHPPMHSCQPFNHVYARDILYKKAVFESVIGTNCITPFLNSFKIPYVDMVCLWINQVLYRSKCSQQEKIWSTLSRTTTISHAHMCRLKN
jgi:hypothetical protein